MPSVSLFCYNTAIAVFNSCPLDYANTQLTRRHSCRNPSLFFNYTHCGAGYNIYFAEKEALSGKKRLREGKC